MSRFELTYRSYADLSRLIHEADIKAFRNYDLIVGVPRSGMIPAYMLGLRLNLPVIDLDGFLNGNRPVGGKRLTSISDYEFKNVLVVDDSIRFGSQLKEVRERLALKPECTFSFCTPFATTDNRHQVKHAFEIIDQPRVFQWNIMHSWVYEYSCVDIDGVLCDDPTEEENDDGEKYIHFLLNAPLKYKPKVPVKTLVTNRLEKYRPETERWLTANGIKYQDLLMLDLPDKATRQRLGLHGTFKAEVYAGKKDTLLFIESDRWQAEKINSITGRAVFCVDDLTFLPPVNKKHLVHMRVASKFKKLLRRI